MVSLLCFFQRSDLLAHLPVAYYKKYPPTWHSGADTFFINTLLVVVLSCVTFSSYATGPSSARIYIKPATYNDKGVVLFKAYKNIDYMGGGSDKKFSFMWLVVSANGVWEEVPHKILLQPEYNRSNAKKSLEKEERKQTDFLKAVDFYYDEYASELDWSHPPKSLLPLIKKYGFKPRPGFNENEGRGTVTWSSKGICLNGKCTKSTVPQRTLGNKISSEAYTNSLLKGDEIVEIKGKAIQSVFYHAGVALFKNGNYKILNGKYEETDTDEAGADSIGAMFDFNISEKDGLIIDYDFIDAISIVPKNLRGQSPNPNIKR